ncbi:hypothetical protein Glove_299g18 [Diversispora epigaea]|uniref:HSA domain-containing protein n=1 Tax=Diversispora epigaea TaxID=1348612 RepID=A0A397HX58_9GLOM|nr:hypothetical protein Glove_299g18 [Diversispora epigaea]
MEADVSLTDKEKVANLVGDGSLMLDAKDLRNKAEEIKNQELKEILDKHESALKHLFYMNYILNKSDSIETYTQIIIDDPSDLSDVDQAKLREFLLEHKLDREKRINIEKSSPNNKLNTIPTTLQQQASSSSSSTTTTTSSVDQAIQPKKPKRVSLPPVERMITRAASGAINPKSVDEILKDAERLGGFPTTPIISQIPNITQNRQSSIRVNMSPKNKDQKKPVTIPPRNVEGSSRQVTASQAVRGGPGHTLTRSFDRDSLVSNYSNQPMYRLLHNPKKVLTTENWKVARDEVKANRVIRRIDELKEESKWSYRQYEPFRDPPRRKTVWDFMIDEALWLQKDFREERKWKIAMAFHMVRWVRDWHNAENKVDLCIKAKEPNYLNNQKRAEEKNENQNQDASSSDEVIDVESVDDEASSMMPPPIAPNVVHNLRQQVFSVPLDEFICELKGPDGQIVDPESIFPDLPPYDRPRPSDKEFVHDYFHQCRIMPITKRMYQRPPQVKRSRKRASDDDDQQSTFIKRAKHDESEMADEQQDSASTLFTLRNVERTVTHVNAPMSQFEKDDIPENRRNSSLMEAIKKASKKRTEAAIKQSQARKNTDQPNQVTHRVFTPIELSRAKSDRERQPPAGIPYLAQGRNQLQFMIQQRQAAAIAAQQQRHPVQQMTPAMAQQAAAAQHFYNSQYRVIQNAQPQPDQQIQQHQQVGQPQPPPPSQPPTIQSQQSQASLQSQSSQSSQQS